MKVFIAGPRAAKKLNESIEDRLYNIFSSNFTVLVGDASGVDRLIQNYYYNLNYDNVLVYASRGIARNNIGNWTIENVAVDDKIKGFDFYAQKDIAMARDADYGFMIWNGKSKGTLNNIINLVADNKKVLVYFIPGDKFISINDKFKLEQLISICPEETKKLYDSLNKKLPSQEIQVSFLDTAEN